MTPNKKVIGLKKEVRERQKSEGKTTQKKIKFNQKKKGAEIEWELMFVIPVIIFPPELIKVWRETIHKTLKTNRVKTVREEHKVGVSIRPAEKK